MSIKIGDPAPEFTLEDKDGNKHTLTDIQEDYIVLYFYPKDDTPGCTIEAIDFTELEQEFTKKNAKVIGISGGTNKTKEKFCQKHNLSILLLTDLDFVVCKAYGAYGEKKFMGRTFNGIKRTTYIINKERKIKNIFINVKAKGHAKEVLEYVGTLSM